MQIRKASELIAVVTLLESFLSPSALSAQETDLYEISHTIEKPDMDSPELSDLPNEIQAIVKFLGTGDHIF